MFPPFPCLNPLHCGAVVASDCGRVAPHGGPSSFNPLHCGAVVASPARTWRASRRSCAFQSPSLRGSGRFRMRGCICCAWRTAFQSPSLRGSGRFPEGAGKGAHGGGGFNPLHCGAVVASGGTMEVKIHIPLVSIPFIAGQWSL